MSAEPLRILLVEDNPGDARMVHEVLRETSTIHTEVRHVQTLAEAKEIMRKHSSDVILLDLSLPDGHGIETVRQVVQTDPRTSVVIFTGLDDESVGLEAVREGAQDFLIKDQLDSRHLLRAIRYAIERKAAELERERLIAELQDLLAQVKTLRGLLPMCAWCKNIRDEKGEWHALESFIKERSDAEVSHSICPDCSQKALHERV